MRFGFFDSEITGQTPEGMPIFDRAENAEFYAEYWGNLVGNGVYKDSTNFNPTPGTGMTVQLSAGRVYINGYYGSEDNQTTCEIQAASSSLSRIDTIVARLDYVARTITIEVLTGTPGSSPSAPALTQNSDRYEIPIADIRVNSNTSSIASGSITDRREYVRALLPYEFEGVPTLSHSKSGTVHRLTGLPSSSSGLVSAVFTATASYAAGDTMTVDNVPYSIQLSNGEEAEDNLFVSGATVAVIVDKGNYRANFKSGGGLSNSRLALANATAADVAEGKTFYAGNKTLKTGTLVPYKYATGSAKWGDDGSGNRGFTVEVGFRPSMIAFYSLKSESGSVKSIVGWAYNSSTSTPNFFTGMIMMNIDIYSSHPTYTGFLSSYVSVTDTGFTIKSISTLYADTDQNVTYAVVGQ